MSFIKDENGQGMLEYVLIIAIVAVIAIVALVVIKNVAKNKTNDMSGKIGRAHV